MIYGAVLDVSTWQGKKMVSLINPTILRSVCEFLSFKNRKQHTGRETVMSYIKTKEYTYRQYTKSLLF